MTMSAAFALHRVEHPRHELGRMAQVGVDDPDDFGLGGVEPFDDGGAQPELPGAMDDPDRQVARELVRHLRRSRPASCRRR